jgi:hypothetical protein
MVACAAILGIEVAVAGRGDPEIGKFRCNEVALAAT